MVKKLLVAGAIIGLVVIMTAPAAAMPKELFHVEVDCPSGAQTLGFIDNSGSIVGFDE